MFIYYWIKHILTFIVYISSTLHWMVRILNHFAIMKSLKIAIHHNYFLIIVLKIKRRYDVINQSIIIINGVYELVVMACLRLLYPLREKRTTRFIIIMITNTSCTVTCTQCIVLATWSGLGHPCNCSWFVIMTIKYFMIKFELVNSNLRHISSQKQYLLEWFHSI